MNWVYLVRSIECIIQDYSMDTEEMAISVDSLINERTGMEVSGFVLFDGIRTAFVYEDKDNNLRWCLLSKIGEREHKTN